MPKWSSPLFSDIRNALGESVVFSNWKGRGYFRGWVKPANPRTNPQQSNRDVLRQLVKRWQAISADAPAKKAWNDEALPYLVSGFNIFTRYGMKSEISCPDTSTTTAPVTITYKCGIPLQHAKVYAFDGSNWMDITPAEGLSESGSFEHTFTNTGTYEIYLVHQGIADVLAGQVADNINDAAVTKWSRDTVNGVAKEAKITIS